MFFPHFLIDPSPYNIILQMEVIRHCVHGMVPQLALSPAPCWMLGSPGAGLALSLAPCWILVSAGVQPRWIQGDLKRGWRRQGKLICLLI